LVVRNHMMKMEILFIRV